MFNFAKFLIFDLPQLVLMAETLFKGLGRVGAQKKALVMAGMQGLLDSAVKAGVSLPMPADQIMYLVGLLNDAFVQQKNLEKAFDHYGGPEK